MAPPVVTKMLLQLVLTVLILSQIIKAEDLPEYPDYPDFIEDECEQYTKCGECMSNPDCHWCPDVKQKPKCSSYPSPVCSSQDISVQNEEFLISNAKLSVSTLINFDLKSVYFVS